MKKLITTAFLVLALTGCVLTGYQFGDVSTAYCAAATPEGRAALKATLKAVGVAVPANYCATVGLIDALAQLKE